MSARLTQIVVVADTHAQTVRELPEGVLQAIEEAEWVVHCGDYTAVAVLEELRLLARNFVGVYGNTDPSAVRAQLPAEVILELQGRKMAVVHPHWGGHPDGLEEALAAQFPHVDAILFGHTHEPRNLRLNGILFLNPGQGYASFMVPASLGMVTISEGELRGELFILDEET